MSDHQRRLWQNMIELIQSYLNEETIDFHSLVGQLEGALDASDIDDKILINQWYDLWTPLEIRRAIQGNSIEKQEAIQDLVKMKEFVLEIQNKQN